MIGCRNQTSTLQVQPLLDADRSKGLYQPRPNNQCTEGPLLVILAADNASATAQRYRLVIQFGPWGYMQQRQEASRQTLSCVGGQQEDQIRHMLGAKGTQFKIEMQ